MLSVLDHGHGMVPLPVRKRLGISPELYCAPLFFGLAGDKNFECIADVVAGNAARLRGHDLEAAFLTPIDYARESSDYYIIPGIAISSRTPTDTIDLLFKEGLHTIKTLAVHPGSTSEVVLASILLSEQFDIRPTIIPTMASPDSMLQIADAALLVGDPALELAGLHRNVIDLVEEWHDMTGLPYVHGFWCTRPTDMTKNDVGSIQNACDHGRNSLSEIAQSASTKLATRYSPAALRQYLESFSFTFTDEEQESLAEFLRYAYYHGVLPDVAEVNFYPLEGEDEGQLTGPSLN